LPILIFERDLKRQLRSYSIPNVENKVVQTGTGNGVSPPLVCLVIIQHYLQKKSEAIAHLDCTIKEYREEKMQPSLERALRHKEILKA